MVKRALQPNSQQLIKIYCICAQKAQCAVQKWGADTEKGRQEMEQGSKQTNSVEGGGINNSWMQNNMLLFAGEDMWLESGTTCLQHKPTH